VLPHCWWCLVPKFFWILWVRRWPGAMHPMHPVPWRRCARGDSHGFPRSSEPRPRLLRRPLVRWNPHEAWTDGERRCNISYVLHTYIYYYICIYICIYIYVYIYICIIFPSIFKAPWNGSVKYIPKVFRWFVRHGWNSNNYIDSIDGGSPMIHGGNHQPISGGGNLLLFQQYYPIYIPHFFAWISHENDKRIGGRDEESNIS
jgi:hypothetical protein